MASSKESWFIDCRSSQARFITLATFLCTCFLSPSPLRLAYAALRSPVLLNFWLLFLQANHRSLRSNSLTLIPFRSAVRPILELLSQSGLWLDFADTARRGGFVNPISPSSEDVFIDVAVLLFSFRWLSNHRASSAPGGCVIGVRYMPNLRRVAAFRGVGKTEPGPSRSSATPMN